MPQNSCGLLGHDLRAGDDAVDGHGADHQRHHGVGRNAEREQRNEGGLRAGIVGRLRPGHALDGALARSARGPWRASSPACRRRTARARRRCPAAGPGAPPRNVPRSDRPCRLRACPCGWAAGCRSRRARRRGSASISRLRRISAKPNMPMAMHGDIDAVGDLAPAERQALLAGLEIGADGREQDADQDDGDRLQHRAARQHDGEHQAQHHQREIVGRAEQQRHARSAARRARR